MSSALASTRPGTGADAGPACSLRHVAPPHARERGLLAVVGLTAVMMVVEIVAGYATHSMALTADGWHMATHVGALGLSAAAYRLARRYANHQAFAFGTGKVQALAGYTSALLLAVVALSMAFESVARLLAPSAIDFATSLPVAIVGLIVNLVSVRLLHGDEHHDAHDHEPHGAHDREPHGAHAHESHGAHDHEHHDAHDQAPHHGHAHADHNHRAALMHVVADALTSGLAIIALLAGRYLQVAWLDPVTGIVGAAVILKWVYDLCKQAGRELLDMAPHADEALRIRRALEQNFDVRVDDLHLWSLGPDKRCCIATVIARDALRPVEEYRARVLSACALCHLTIEVRQGT